MPGERRLPDLVARVRVDTSELDAISGKSQRVGKKVQQDLGHGGAAKGAKQFEEAMHHSAQALGETAKGTEQLSRKLGALHGLMNTGLATGVSAFAVTAGVGLGIEAAKSAIEIAEKREKAEKDLDQAVASRNAADKKTVPDLSKVRAATSALEGAQRSLEEFDVGHKGHKLTALQLMQRQDAVARVTAATKELNAAQAAAVPTEKNANLSREALKKTTTEFIATNRRYIKDQSEVVESYAKLTRQGLSYEKIQRDMNLALDLAATKGISLSDATDLVSKAEDGRFKGLIGLGIETKNLTNDMGDQVVGADKVDQIMGELVVKEKDGRKSTTDLDQAQNDLSNRWQEASVKIGPPLLQLFTDMLTKASDLYDGLEAFGKDDSWWKGLNDGLINVLKTLQQIHYYASFSFVSDALSHSGDAPTPGAATGGKFGGTARPRASGGPVSPFQAYRWRERGDEIFVPDQPGQVYPHGASVPTGKSVTNHLTLVGTPVVNDPDGVRRMLRRMEMIGAAS